MLQTYHCVLLDLKCGCEDKPCPFSVRMAPVRNLRARRKKSAPPAGPKAHEHGMSCTAWGAYIILSPQHVARSELLRQMADAVGDFNGTTIDLPFPPEHVHAWAGLSTRSATKVALDVLEPAIRVRMRIYKHGPIATRLCFLGYPDAPCIATGVCACAFRASMRSPEAATEREQAICRLQPSSRIQSFPTSPSFWRHTSGLCYAAGTHMEALRRGSHFLLQNRVPRGIARWQGLWTTAQRGHRGGGAGKV